MVILAVAALFAYVIFDKLFVIQGFRVKGASETEYTAEQAEAMAEELGLKKGMHLFGFNRKAAEQTARFALSEFDSVRIRYALPDTVVLDVKEAEPAMYVSVGGAAMC